MPASRGTLVHGTLVQGVSAAWRGFKLATSNRDVGRTYLLLAGVVFAVALFLDVGGIWAIVHLTAPDGTESWWAALGMLLLRIAGIGIVLLAAPIIALFTVNTVAPLLGERVFLAGLRAVNPARADELANLKGLPMSTAVAQNLIRLVLFIGLSLGSLAVSFVPVVGSVAGPVLQGYFTARALGWELLDPYFEKLGYKFDAQHAFMKQHRSSMLGFALPYSFVMAIPLVGPLVFGVAQAATGTLVNDVLERAPDSPS